MNCAARLDSVAVAIIVRHMPKKMDRLDRVFHALGDPTRRAVVSRLSTGRAAVSELARPFDMALPSFMQHLGVLEDCGLVRSRKVGRVRTYRLEQQPLKAAEHWMTEQRALWRRWLWHSRFRAREQSKRRVQVQNQSLIQEQPQAPPFKTKGGAPSVFANSRGSRNRREVPPLRRNKKRCDSGRDDKFGEGGDKFGD